MEERISNLESDLHRLSAKLIQLAWKVDDVDKKTPDEPSLDFQDEIINISSRLENIEERLESLSNRVNEPDVGFSGLPITKLLSHSLWTRMWAVWGHSVLGNILFVIVLYILFFILGNGINLPR
jgi:hypothetical protein